MRVRIEHRDGSTRCVNVATGENMNDVVRGYELRHYACEPPRIILLLKADVDVTAEAECVAVPQSLVDRANEMKGNMSPETRDAVSNLLGITL